MKQEGGRRPIAKNSNPAMDVWLTRGGQVTDVRGRETKDA